LINSKCVPCPSNCDKCSSGKCGSCRKGYTPNSSGVCVLRCSINCKSCVDNQPSNCLSCYKGSNLEGNTCKKDLSCNADNSCSDCGQGTGYIRVASKCFKCPNIPNALQCSEVNPQIPSICVDGYFVDGRRCSQCPTICKTCRSSSICTSCIPGYTLPNKATSGFCIAC